MIKALHTKSQLVYWIVVPLGLEEKLHLQNNSSSLSWSYVGPQAALCVYCPPFRNI
jgi:hypothetical protein